MRPLPISPETAQRLARELNVPIEHLMHMPQHILMQKLAELAKKKPDESAAKNDAPESGRPTSE
ncbi:YycC family protein [Paenibacillus naphthalenovorans]|uniref:YycC-like protein n=1 Tax=Paenibacillus naphthalenovorans TaxID=162209 RepID=A0A0U2W503_9BACL|nr:YycC family protein [Paenibacillus naphthalenovorans]ALS20506.1 YycC-like protein [Paenibacillus naphthalenovorans]SDI68395.1 YycC-like protein [Paenibacillus naphthalenovorans]